VELRDRKKDYNLCHVYCKAKEYFQKGHKFFQINLEKGLKWKGRENGLTQKDLMLECFCPLERYSSLYYEILFEALFFFSLFSIPFLFQLRLFILGF
jgi:hypothetical protein